MYAMALVERFFGGIIFNLNSSLLGFLCFFFFNRGILSVYYDRVRNLFIFFSKWGGGRRRREREKEWNDGERSFLLMERGAFFWFARKYFFYLSALKYLFSFMVLRNCNMNKNGRANDS